MKLQNLLTPDCTVCAVQGNSKKRILEKISQIASTKLPEISQQELLDSLICREKMGSTGIGHGIASIAEYFSNKANSKKVRACSSNDELFQLISQS